MTSDPRSFDEPALAALFDAAAAPAEAPLPGEADALAAFRARYQPLAGRRPGRRVSRRSRLAAAAVFGGAVMISGVAAAAGGVLPLVPSHHDGNPQRPAPSHAPASPSTDGDSGAVSPSGHASPEGSPGTGADHGQGDEVSDAARSPGAEGRDHGRAVCTAASQDRCHSGGKADEHANEKSAHHRDPTADHRTKPADNDGSGSLPGLGTPQGKPATGKAHGTPHPTPHPSSQPE